MARRVALDPCHGLTGAFDHAFSTRDIARGAEELGLETALHSRGEFTLARLFGRWRGIRRIR
ncbi:MAG: hypothetical protein VX719_07380, partial [Pseudomonadota bacterium]|nr:hypothetical protein [Pseudomonadota bacterium]